MYLKRVEIKNLWGKNVSWDLNSDVNILIGINGSGKSTILQLIEEALSPKKDEDLHLQKFLMIDEMMLELDNNLIIQVNSNERVINNKEAFKKLNLTSVDTFDVPRFNLANTADLSSLAANFDLSLSTLDIELKNLKEEYTTFQRDYLSNKVKQLLNTKENNASQVEEPQELLSRESAIAKIINRLFKETDKEFDDANFNFKQNGTNNPIELKKLSSGEKQILIILLKCFLQQKQPFIYLLDEPEISLHITWQRQLIGILKELNPNCQIILATHSATIFYLNWESNVIRINNIVNEASPNYQSQILTSSQKPTEGVIIDLREQIGIAKNKHSHESGQIFHINKSINTLTAISLDTAKAIINLLKDNNLQLNEITLNNLITKTLNLEEAKSLLEEYDKENIVPNELVLTILLKKANNVKEGIDLINELKDQYLTFYPYIHVFYELLSKATNSEEVELVEEARKYYSIPITKEYIAKLKMKR